MRPSRQSQSNIITEEFLYRLYKVAMEDQRFAIQFLKHMDLKYLPNQHLQKLHTFIVRYFSVGGQMPDVVELQQNFRPSIEPEISQIISDIEESKCDNVKTESAMSMWREYLRSAKQRTLCTEIATLFNKGDYDKIDGMMQSYLDWRNNFGVDDTEFVEIISTIPDRLRENKIEVEKKAEDTKPRVSRFYIDQLDALNKDRDLRSQLTVLLASTGVGKTHAARHIGVSAAVDSGLNVVHFQLEGSREEALNGYSGAILGTNSYWFEHGKVNESEAHTIAEDLKNNSGKIFVKCFPRFNNKVSTVDLKNALKDFKTNTGLRVDVIIVDSMDLLEDSSGINYDSKDLRIKRISVANDLKDLAGDEDAWIVATYQATIENQDWLNDEKNVLTEYNCAEAKGITRPMTHLISLNQSSAEREEKIMRLHVAKSRFFKKGGTFKIANDFDKEVFFDKVRSHQLRFIER